MDSSHVPAQDDSAELYWGQEGLSVVGVMYQQCGCVIKYFIYSCFFSVLPGIEVLHTSTWLESDKDCFCLSPLPSHRPWVWLNAWAWQEQRGCGTTSGIVAMQCPWAQCSVLPGPCIHVGVPVVLHRGWVWIIGEKLLERCCLFLMWLCLALAC